MFVATYPASFLPEANGKALHVRFPDLPEALTGGDDLEDTLAQATDCLAEAMAGRIARGDEIPPPSKPKRGQRLISVPLYLAPKLALYLAMRERGIPDVEPEAPHQTREDSGGVGSTRQAYRHNVRGCRMNTCT